MSIFKKQSSMVQRFLAPYNIWSTHIGFICIHFRMPTRKRGIVSSKPAPPHFLHKCLPNEKQIENPQKLKYFFKKCVWTKRSPPKQIFQWSKKCRIRLIRSAIIKKASQVEHQNEITITTNNSYIQNFMSIFSYKKLNKMVKIPPDKAETTWKNWQLTRKELWPLHNKIR